jgi:hypothetical protein
MPTENTQAVINEIKAQLTQIDIKLKNLQDMSLYVKLLCEKRQLEELLRIEQNGRN